MSHVYRVRFVSSLLLFFFAAPVLAAVPLASPQADRLAKFAVPAAGKALLYVYRGGDPSEAPLTVVLNGRIAARLSPHTFMVWTARPGRYELTAPGTTRRLMVQVQGGSVYYVELARAATGIPTLRSVSFAVGRTAIHRARLIAGTTAVTPPAVTRPPVTQAPVTRPQVTQPPVRPPVTRPPTAAAPAAAPRRGVQNFAIMLKFGSFSLANDSQDILGAARAFDTSASSVASFEGEWFVRPDISLGLEVTKFSNDYSTPSATAIGSTDTTAVLLNAKRYFLPGGAWQPYIGAGLGSATVDFSGAITGSTSGFAPQAVAGIQWRADQLALRAEYKYLKADTKDNGGQKVDMSGGGLFLGIGFYF